MDSVSSLLQYQLNSLLNSVPWVLQTTHETVLSVWHNTATAAAGAAATAAGAAATADTTTTTTTTTVKSNSYPCA
jgi:hypothetical protein